MSDPYKTPYEYFGETGVRQLADAFYDAMNRLPEAAEIRAMHGADLTPMRKALTAYLNTWMGGPSIYLALKGSMCLTDAHAPLYDRAESAGSVAALHGGCVREPGRRSTGEKYAADPP